MCSRVVASALGEGLDDRITRSCGCELPPSQISGLVYFDQNRDGFAQDTEPRLEGVNSP